MCGHPEKRFHLSKVTLLQMNCKLLVDYVLVFKRYPPLTTTTTTCLLDLNIYIFLFKIRDLCCRPDTQV